MRTKGVGERMRRFPWQIVLGLLLLMTSNAWAAPAVTAFSPEAGSYGPISATFGEPMDPTTVRPGSFTVSRFIGLKSIAAGKGYSLALRNDGTVTSWGWLGAGSPPADLSGITAVAAGVDHAVALKNDGTVVSWGGAWGSEDFIYAESMVPDGLSGVAAVAAGPDLLTVVVKSDGTVAAWGFNYYGEADVPAGLTGVVAVAPSPSRVLALKNDGTVTSWGAPGYEAPAELTGVIAIAAGDKHRVALKSDGTVVAWGDNAYGQSAVPPGLSNVVAIAAGAFHTLALKSDGTMAAWGANWYGQVTVPAGLSNLIGISGGYAHTMALKSDGSVVAWGYNEYDQSRVPRPITGVTAISAGNNHTLVVKNDGTVDAWGSLTRPPASLAAVSTVASGEQHLVALKKDGTVVAWGVNQYGQATVPAALSGVTAVAAGLQHSVALRNDGTVVAWGRNQYGQTTVPAGLTGVVAIAAGRDSSYALKNDGTVVAWGANHYGQITLPAGLSGVVAIAAGAQHAAAVKSDGTVVAWGKNYYGESTVPAGLTGVTAVTAGWNHTVALKSDGTVVAWGLNMYGESQVPPGLAGVTAINARWNHTVALKSDGTVVAWGDNACGKSSVAWTTPQEKLIEGTVVYDQENRTAFFTPSVPLAPGAYFATVNTGARNSAGAHVAADVRWSFLTDQAALAAIALDGLVQQYDGNPKPVTATTTPPGLPVQVTYNGSVTPPSAAGSYDVVATIVEPNYQRYQGSAAGTLRITPVMSSQIITVTQPAPATVPCDSSFTVTAVASSGLPVTITASGSCSASNTTDSATIVIGNGSLGACYLSYSQAGSDRYHPAPAVVSTTELEMKKQVITFEPLPDKEYGDPAFTVSATASSALDVSFSSSTPDVCTVAGNVVTMVWPGTCTIMASQAGNAGCCPAEPVTQSFNVGPGGLHQFAVELKEPGAKVAGKAFGIIIKAQNVLNETVTSFSGTVNLSTDAGRITPAVSMTFTNGKWEGDVTVTGAGSGKTITASAGKKGTSSPFTVNPAAAVAFTLSAPTRATIGVGFNVWVTAKDIYNNVATGYLGTVHFTSSDPFSKLPPDQQFAATDNGTRMFSNVVLNTADEQTVTATDTLDPGIDGVSPPIAVTNDANRRLRVTAPATMTAGETVEVTVDVEDPDGNQASDYRGTVTFSSTDGQGALERLSYTFTEADKGRTTFTATLRTAGNQTVTAADGQISAVRGTSGSIRVFPAAAAKLDFKPQPVTTMAGRNIAPAVAVRVLDQYGNLVTDSTAAVTLAIGSNPSGGTLSGTATRNAAGGIATFADLSIDKAGNGYRLTAVSDSLTGATSNLFDILAGTFYRFAISTIGPQTVTHPFAITVTAKDFYDNTVTEFTEAARLSISDGSSISPTSTGAFVAGMWSGPVTVNGGGTGRTVTVTRTIGTESGVSNPFTANKLNQMITVTKPAPVTAEDRSTFVVSASASSGLQVAITTSGVCTGSGAGSAQITMTAGAGTCTVHYNQAGNWNYDPAPGVTGSTEATAIIKQDQAITIDIPAPPSAPCDGIFTVTATASSGLEVSITTSGACTGSGTGSAIITVPRGTGACTILYNQPGNPYFNPAPQLSSTTAAHPVEQSMTFEPLPDRTIGDVPFQISATATSEMPVLFTSLTPEVCTVSGSTVTLVGVGTCTIRAAQDGECCVATPMERSFNVRPAPAVVFTVTAPATASAGVPFDVLVTAKDRYGNVATGYAGTVHLTSTDPNSMIILPPDFQFTPELDQGVHLFSGVVLMTAGNQTITATDTVAPSISGTSGSIRINPAGGRALKVTAPATATAGTPIDVVVTVEDIYQNVVTDYTGTVHLTSTDSQALLPAEYAFVAADQGSKALTVTLKSAGDQTVTAADTEIAGTSGSIRVGHAVAGGLRFEQQPTTVTAGTTILPAPAVKIVDQYGNFVADSSAPITIAIGNNPSSGTLSGTRTVNAVNGVATFGDLAIDMVGSGYTLTATSGESSATSIVFDVTPGPSDYLFSGFLPPVDLGKPFKLGSTIPVKFQLTDANGAIVTSAQACLEVVRTSNEVMIGDPIEITGNKDEGNCFRVSEGVYIYNLDTTGLEVGTYHIHAVIDATTTHMIGMALK